MSTAQLNARNQALRENWKLTNGLGGTVLHTVYALPISKLATVELGATTGAIGQSFWARFGTHVQRILKTALSAGVAAHQGTFQTLLQLVQPP